MKQITNVSIGSKSFTLSVEAYKMLDSWLRAFKAGIKPESEADDVMIEIEERIAELFSEEGKGLNYVIDTDLVGKVIARLGMPDGSSAEGEFKYKGEEKFEQSASRKFYRDNDNRVIGGVCSGISLYFNIDVLLVRILFFILLLCGTSGFWIYMILWLLAPLADTAAKKCELRGLPQTAENLRKFSKTN